MLVVRSAEACPRPAGGSVATIGAYDGLHRGHRTVIDLVRRRAAELGAVSAVVTFDRHPAEVVRPESAPCLLVGLDEKLELLEEAGVEVCLVITFDAERAREEPEDFVREVLVDCLRVREVIVGADFHFGHRRRGDTALLERMGAELGFGVRGLDLYAPDGGEPISSTAVRQALRAGDLERVEALLGRPHSVRGTVVRGDQRGRQLGFPTANVALDPRRCLPPEGIYAGWYRRPDGSRHPAAISLGRRPTFYDPGEAPVLLEAHLLDFEGDLYGETATVTFTRWIRPEERFSDVDALVARIREDTEAVRRVLAVG